MLKGNRLLICFIGFGTFKVRNRAERKGRNPQTGKAIIIPATKVQHLKLARNLKKPLNIRISLNFKFLFSLFLKCSKNAIDFNPYFVCSGAKSPNLNKNFIIDFVI